MEIHFVHDCMHTVSVSGCAAAYLDVVVIHSTSWSEHLQHVRCILQKLREAGLTVKPEVPVWHDPVFLPGSCGWEREVRPEQSKLEAVENFPIPFTKRHIRAFLGLTGYYRRFIADYANVALPLTDLTKKDAPNRIRWTTAFDEAFKRLKSCCVPLLCCEALTSRSHLSSRRMPQTEVLGQCLAKLM